MGKGAIVQAGDTCIQLCKHSFDRVDDLDEPQGSCVFREVPKGAVLTIIECGFRTTLRVVFQTRWPRERRIAIHRNMCTGRQP